MNECSYFWSSKETIKKDKLLHICPGSRSFPCFIHLIRTITMRRAWLIYFTTHHRMNTAWYILTDHWFTIRSILIIMIQYLIFIFMKICKTIYICLTWMEIFRILLRIMGRCNRDTLFVIDSPSTILFV